MDTRRVYPRFAIASLLGNVAFLASWGVVLMRPSGWQVVGPLLLLMFLVLRVGGMWFFASKHPPEERPRMRRTATFTTVLALIAVGIWVYTVLQGPRGF
ncbi:hypothetical protein [Corallococcus macrosporus]|uniref:Uncharacterized protein n=2 Tax=Myxococcaceae TaxID=31 RepID=A0A250JN96_9BACT|nr:hypothetical protein [Corallococcus macrosporus]AEI63250.1 hypothetical protein LILAB_06665 [Corallococcus macrosporus]ATB44861.1 hypothetical protein MYMAC_000443 [Corallococcus macrosporus DSM 14697]